MSLLLPFAILLLIFAAILRIELLFAVVWLLLGLYVLARLWVRRASAQLRVERRFADRAFTGDRMTVELSLVNTGRLPIPWVELEESVPLELRSTELRQVVNLGSRERRDLSYPLACRRRGYYQLGPSRVVTGDVLGVEDRILTLTEPRRLIVYPRIVPLERLGLPTRSALTQLPARVPIFEDATRVMGVRDYQAGDPLRRIHWSATARLNRLVVKQHQPAIARETLIGLDLLLGDFDVWRRYDAAEMAVVAAASLAHHIILREGLPAGLAAAARDPLDKERSTIVVPARSERSHLTSLLEVLARAQPVRGEGFARLLRQESTRLSWGATIVVIAGGIDGELAETLLYLKRSGFALAAVLVQPVERRHGASIAGVPVHHIWTDEDLAAVS